MTHFFTARLPLFAIASAFCGMLATTAPAAVLTSQASDANVGKRGDNGVVGVHADSETLINVGKNWWDPDNFVAVFQLPTVPEGMQFADASFKVYGQRYNSYGVNADLYGLGYRTSGTVLATDYYVGGTPDTTDADLIQDSFLSTSIPDYYATINTSETGDTELTAYLNEQYALASINNPGEDIYVFLRMNPKQTTGGTYRWYNVRTGDYSTSSTRPTITYEIAPVPEPASLALLALGGACLISRRRRR